ncbi:hypothetical protein VTI74DRAFT_10729 [Chaetomium olivicolor]
MFDDKYYANDMADGGERAAVDLHAAVQGYLKSTDPRLAALPVVTKAFASGEGLATLLVKAGMSTTGDAPRAVSRFTRGFSQAGDTGEFVLLGKGKDRADHKLMGECLIKGVSSSLSFLAFFPSHSVKHLRYWTADSSTHPRCLPSVRGKSKLPACSPGLLP